MSDGPIITNDDMKYIRDGFHKWNLPESIFGKVYDKISELVKSGIYKIDDAVKKVIGKDSLSEDIKIMLQEWQYHDEANQSFIKTVEPVTTGTGEKGISFLDEKRTEPMSFSEEGKINNPEQAEERHIQVRYEPSKYPMLSNEEAQAIKEMQVMLMDMGYGTFMPRDFGMLNEKTWNAFLKYAHDNGLAKNPSALYITDDILKKMREQVSSR